MFERFNEKARRVIFFARYEASQYGSSYVDAEHLLLGLWREDYAIRAYLNDNHMESAVRAEVERGIVRAKPFATSVEVPLSTDAKKVLHFAAEEADRMARREITPAHILVGILRIKESLGARVAMGRGASLQEARERLAKSPDFATVAQLYRRAVPGDKEPAWVELEEFLTGLKKESTASLISFFGKQAQIVDVQGRRWSFDELALNFESIFAPYAKKNATYVIEETVADTASHLVVIVLWKNALVASMERVWMHRMTVVLVPRQEWEIVSIHVTPVQP